MVISEKKRALERRRHTRFSVVRSCKVRDRRTLLFSAGKTSDLSESGALIRVDRTRPFAEGDVLELVISWNGERVLSSEGLLRATVRRVTPIDYHHQAVAVEFEQSMSARPLASIQQAHAAAA